MSKYFDPTHLEVTSIDVANKTDNLIPNQTNCKFNIRFNDNYQGTDLAKFIDETCKKTLPNYHLKYRISGESFYNKDEEFSEIVKTSIKNITGQTTVLSTSGGTSDARFIKNICSCIEFGLINKTAHQIDEQISIEDLRTLKEIYKEILVNYFK